MRSILAGLTLTLVAVLGPNAQAQKTSDNDRDAGKRQTVRGVIAGVTVAGETAIDYATRRAATVEMTYMTVVGSPAWDPRTRTVTGNGADGDRGRHNVYVIRLGPGTEVRNSTGLGGEGNKDVQGDNPDLRGKRATIDDLEVGDRVRVSFDRRESPNSNSGGDPQARKHGRHRTYFGDAISVDILSAPDRDQGRRPAGPNDRDRDDDKDKVKVRSRANDRDDSRPTSKGEKAPSS